VGESLVIGGIRKSEKRDVIRGVPILKDIPGLNLLFSGRDFEERATEVIFILTPTISTGGKPNADVMEMLKARHASPMTQAIHETMTDPLGIKAREEDNERRMEAREAQRERRVRARDARMRAEETERAAARLEAMQTGQQIQDEEDNPGESEPQADPPTPATEQAAPPPAEPAPTPQPQEQQPPA
jgi:cell division septation protein DedD